MSQSEPLVTVYITNYNYGRFIRQSIESVLKQTLENFEILIIDDGSTDQSRQIIEQYSDHPKITTIFQQNRGLNVTNNIALRASRGKYIMRLDADDYLDAHALDIMSGVLEREPDAGLVFPDYFLVDDVGGVMDMVRRHNFDDVTVLDQPAHGACTMFRKEALLEVDGYDESYRCQDGWDIWVRLIDHFRVQNVNLPLFYYRQHGENLTRNEQKILSTRAEIVRRQATTKHNTLQSVAVIAVRGGNAGREALALRTLGGRCLIDWGIDAALAAKNIQDVVITTPDQHVIEHVKGKYQGSVTVLQRSPELAKINTALNQTFIEVLNHFRGGRSIEAIVHLGILSPFRTSQHIDTAVELLSVFDTDSIVGVRPETDIFFQHNGEGLQPLRQSLAMRLEREDLFRDPGALRAFRTDGMHQSAPDKAKRVGHIVLDSLSSMSLQGEFEWQVAEAMIAQGLVV